MNAQVISRSINQILDTYSDWLKSVDEERFSLTPAEGVWSQSEVFSHIIQANFRSLLAIQKCIYGKAESSKNISLIGQAILFFGAFPPIKLKAPASMAALVKKISKEEARNDLVKLKSKVQELSGKISKCSSNYRIKHPRLGMLNACEWLRFIEIHSKHHLKQLRKIDKQLAVKN